MKSVLKYIGILFLTNSCIAQTFAHSKELTFLGIKFGDTISNYKDLIQEVDQSYIFGDERRHFCEDKNLLFENIKPFTWVTVYSIEYKVFSLNAFYDKKLLSFEKLQEAIKSKFGLPDSVGESKKFDNLGEIVFNSWKNNIFTIELYRDDDRGKNRGILIIDYNYLKELTIKKNTYRSKGNSTFKNDFASLHNIFLKNTTIKEFESKLPEFVRTTHESNSVTTRVTYNFPNQPNYKFEIEYNQLNIITYFGSTGTYKNLKQSLKKFGYRESINPFISTFGKYYSFNQRIIFEESSDFYSWHYR